MHRLALLWRFYSPAIRKQLIICGVVLFVSYFMCLAGSSGFNAGEGGGLWLALYSLGAMIAGWVYYAAPLVFGFCSQRRVATTLPASWQEKALFMFGYVFVVVPLFLALVWYGCVAVMSIFTPDANVTSNMMESISAEASGLSLGAMMKSSKYMSVVSYMASVALACYVIVIARRNRITLGIVAILAYSFLNWLCGVALGIYAVVRSKMFEHIAEGREPDMNPQLLVDIIAGAMPVLAVLCGMLLVLFVVLATLKIKTRQN